MSLLRSQQPFKIVKGIGVGGSSIVVLVEKQEESPLPASSAEDLALEGEVLVDETQDHANKSSSKKVTGKSTATNIRNHCDVGKHNVKYAMKVSPKYEQNPRRQQNLRLHISNEINALLGITASCFVQQQIDMYESPTKVYFFLEYVSGGDLFSHLSQRQRFTVEETRFIQAEVFLGIEHLHQCNFLHCDIKIENIVVDSRGHIKLIDFGQTVPLNPTALQQPLETNSLSLAYTSPERLLQRTGGRHTDWWAYGVVTYELLTGRNPWSSLENTQVLVSEICAPDSPNLSSEHIDKDEIKDFISSLMEKEVLSRLGTMSDAHISNHPFFGDINWDRVRKQEYDSFFLLNNTEGGGRDSSASMPQLPSPQIRQDNNPSFSYSSSSNIIDDDDATTILAPSSPLPLPDDEIMMDDMPSEVEEQASLALEEFERLMSANPSTSRTGNNAMNGTSAYSWGLKSTANLSLSIGDRLFTNL